MTRVVGNVSRGEVFVAFVGGHDVLRGLGIDRDVEFGDVEFRSTRMADGFAHFFERRRNVAPRERLVGGDVMKSGVAEFVDAGNGKRLSCVFRGLDGVFRAPERIEETFAESVDFGSAHFAALSAEAAERMRARISRSVTNLPRVRLTLPRERREAARFTAVARRAEKEFVFGVFMCLA